jgi:hypothetical protein
MGTSAIRRDCREVAERVELAEVRPIRRDARVVFAAQHLGAAEGVLHGLAEKPGEDEAEGLVGAEIQELHRPPLHRVDEPHAVGEIGAVARDHVEELRQLLRRHREVSVEDHEHVASGRRETGAHGVALAPAGLSQAADGLVGMGRGDASDLLPGVVTGVTLDEDQFHAPAHGWYALDGGGDVARFIARGDDDGNAKRRRIRRAGVFPSGGDEHREAEPLQQRGGPAVEQRGDAQGLEGQQDASVPRHGRPTAQPQQIQHIGRGQPAVLRLPRLEAQEFRERQQRPPERVLEVDHQLGAWV